MLIFRFFHDSRNELNSMNECNLAINRIPTNYTSCKSTPTLCSNRHSVPTTRSRTERLAGKDRHQLIPKETERDRVQKARPSVAVNQPRRRDTGLSRTQIFTRFLGGSDFIRWRNLQLDSFTDIASSSILISSSLLLRWNVSPPIEIFHG